MRRPQLLSRFLQSAYLPRSLSLHVATLVHVHTTLPQAQSAVQTMRDFQAAQRRHISDGLPLEQLCAVSTGGGQRGGRR